MAPRRRRRRRPKTIEELFERQPESGTHSILDCWHVDTSPAPKAMTVAPMPPDAIVAVFATTTPATDSVAELENELLTRFDDVLERWVGRYLVSYRDSRPDQLWFVGFSGD